MKRSTILLALICLASGLPSIASQPSIWFCPMDSHHWSQVVYHGLPEYMQLFTGDAPWKNASKRLNVFKIYPQWVMKGSDDDLKIEFADLARRHIALALEFGLVTNPPGCWFEGCGGNNTLAAVRRIHSDGGDLKYIAMDEPMFFSALHKEKAGCNLSMAQTVANAAANIKAMLAEFPGVQIGDIEPLVPMKGDGLTQEELIARYQEGAEAFKAALGKPLAFFDADLDWNSPTAAHDLKALRRMVDAEHIPFGIIYDGDGNDLSDLSWLNTAKRHMAFAEATAGAPDIVIFQSWHPYPKKLLPETDQDAFTSIINSYFGDRTTLTASVKGKNIAGELKTTLGKPVDSARVDVSIRYRSMTGLPGVYNATGQIPDNAVSALFAIRVNSEGGSGAANIRVAGFKFDADGAPSVARNFASDADLSAWGGLSHAKIENGALHIVTDDKASLIINSAPFPIVTHGNYTFQVNATIPNASDRSGSFAIIFLDAKSEITRNTIPFEEPVTSLGTMTTNRKGVWSMPLPKPPDYASSGFVLTGDYAGDANHWPAQTHLTNP